MTFLNLPGRRRAPTEKVRLLRIAPPDVRLRRHDGMRAIFERVAAGSPIATAVIHPCEASVLQTVLAAVKAGLIVPILVGPEAKIRNAAATAGLDISGFRLVDVPHSHAAARACAATASTAYPTNTLPINSSGRHQRWPAAALSPRILAPGQPLRDARRIEH